MDIQNIGSPQENQNLFKKVITVKSESEWVNC